MTQIFCAAEQGEWRIESRDPGLALPPGRDPSSPLALLSILEDGGRRPSCTPISREGGSEWRDQEGRTPKSKPGSESTLTCKEEGLGGGEIRLLPSPLALSSRAGLGQTPGSYLKDP